MPDLTIRRSPVNLEDNDAAVRTASLLPPKGTLSPLTTLIHNTQAKLALAKQRTTNAQAEPAVRFDGKTAIITGAGAGLGRAYACLDLFLNTPIWTSLLSRSPIKLIPSSSSHFLISTLPCKLLFFQLHLSFLFLIK